MGLMEELERLKWQNGDALPSGGAFANGDCFVIGGAFAIGGAKDKEKDEDIPAISWPVSGEAAMMVTWAEKRWLGIFGYGINGDPMQCYPDWGLWWRGLLGRSYQGGWLPSSTGALAAVVHSSGSFHLSEPQRYS